MAFLKIGVGTDAIGMGQAATSHVNDATASYWNAAGLAAVEGTDLYVMHNEYIADLRLEYASVARRFGRHGIGLSFNGLFTDDLEGRDENGEITGSLGYYNLSVGVGYGLALTDQLNLGIGVKYLREFIGDPAASEDHVAQALATDLGAQYRLDSRFAFGLAVQNLSSDVSFNQVQIINQAGNGPLAGGETFSLPVVVQGGVTYTPDMQIMDGGVEIALEGRSVSGEDASVLFGARYHYRDLAALSVGYRSGLDTEDLSFGLRVDREQLRVGYAFVPYSEDLGSSHRLSLGYRIP